MEAKESKIIDILTENKKYIVPSYQRPYSWDKSNTEQLIDDIYNSFCQDNEEYFIGTLICIHKGNYTYEIVDGQQRLTTLSLIFAKMKNLISENKRAKENLQKRVLPIDDFSDKPQEPRLKVRSKEYDLYYHYILQDNSDFLPESPTFTQRLFIDNFNAIEKYLLAKADEEIVLCNLAKYILEHVYVVFVQTDNFTSSFRLFNVLNTRGMPLAASDLIKNSLVEIADNSGEDYKKVEEYWEKIEDTIGVENLDKFLMINKLSQKKDKNRAIKNLVDEYTEILKNNYSDKAINFTVELLKSAGNYQKIRDLEFDDMALFKVFFSLSHLSDEWLPPILAFINRMDKDGNINRKHFKEFIQLFEKCYMHGWFKKQVRTKREVVCYSVLVAINTGKSVTEILNIIKDNADNEGFLSSLNDDIYEPLPTRINFAKAVLLRIDQEMQDDSVYKIYNGRITIEHILPQRNLNDYWKARFTDKEHAEWLHKLGNLALISGTKNSEAQNSAFDRKKEIYEKNNKKVSFDITKDVCNYPEWNLSSLKKRHQVLVDIAKKIWMI
ncbi:hypothetical protein NOS3756_15130 [Nostoc sp. NIES-3756]|uniref:DUF262 domain-containing protein n=1 Tax=Nostoc sp. NIES-3756 TaxID=1751286 RepID=UPI00071EBD0C|nr:DUF262 domain-containing protein [Nostoc sp. NIES-3756]BAT52573.1 hypothetical protein NOS3756_15130 [Nostoc sp. NIES-3756]